LTSVFLTRGVGVFELRGLAFCQSWTVIRPKMTVHDGLYYKVPLGLFFTKNCPIEDFTPEPSLTVMGTGRKGTLMREKEIEKALAIEARRRGGLALKLVTPTLDGMPDRLVLMPGGKVGFMEVKAPGLKPRALQLARHRMLRNLGFQVFVLDDKAQIGGMLDAIQTT
jgi:hypothetical protein